MFGGYADQKWTQQNAYPVDFKSFLFRLRKNNAKDYVKYGALQNAAIMSNANNWGPAFGNNAGNIALSFMHQNAAIVKAAGQNFFNCTTMTINPAYGYNPLGHGANELNGGSTQMINIEVFEVFGKFLYKIKKNHYFV